MSDYTQAPAPTEPATILVERPRNGMAVASMVLGIIAVVFVWIPFLNVISVVLAVIAIGLGIPALIRANRVHKGLGQAIAGVVLAVVAVLGFFVVNAATVDAIDEAVTDVNEALDAMDEIDVTLGSPSYDGFTTEVPVNVVNVGDETKSFWITVVATSADGSTVYDETSVITADLAPGQSYDDSAMFVEELPADAVISVTDAI